MAYRLSHPKVIQAIDRIVRDIDKKYDECLVDRFLEFIESRAQNDADNLDAERFEDSLVVLNHIKYFTDHKAFVMLNQARALKTFYSILKSNNLTEKQFNEISPYLNSVWNTLDIIIINDNLSAMTIMLSIFIHLSKSELGHRWLMAQEIEPPLRLSDSELNDVISLVRHFLDCKNYHTKNKVENLFEHLILNTRSVDSRQTSLIGDLIRTLLLQGSTSVVHVLNSILSKGYSDLERYNVVDSLQKSFDVMVKQSNFINHCKCLALTSPLSTSHIESCKKNGQLRGLIVYLSCFDCNKSLAYLLYPLISDCRERVNDMLERKLDLSDDEKIFIDKNSKKSIITLCLVQLNQAKSYHNPRLVIDCIIEYITCHWRITTDYRDVMECCSVLLRMQEKCDLLDDYSLNLMDSLHAILSNMIQSNQSKPIIMRLIKILQLVHSKCSKARGADCRTLSVRTLELALNTNDHDILDEFLQFFIMNPHDYGEDIESTKKYINFVWKHVHLNTKDTEHRELLGHLAHLLVDLDLKIESSIFDMFGIKHRHDIPIMLADLLIEKFAILPTVELIVEALEQENLNLGTECLGRLTDGLYTVIKSEASRASRLRAFKILCSIQDKLNPVKPETMNDLKKYIESNDEADDKMELHSMVDDILNYDLISDGILDCY